MARSVWAGVLDHFFGVQDFDLPSNLHILTNKPIAFDAVTWDGASDRATTKQNGAVSSDILRGHASGTILSHAVLATVDGVAEQELFAFAVSGVSGLGPASVVTFADEAITFGLGRLAAGLSVTDEIAVEMTQHWLGQVQVSQSDLRLGFAKNLNFETGTYTEFGRAGYSRLDANGKWGAAAAFGNDVRTLNNASLEWTAGAVWSGDGSPDQVTTFFPVLFDGAAGPPICVVASSAQIPAPINSGDRVIVPAGALGFAIRTDGS